MLILQGAVSLGLIFSLMAIGVYLTFRILEMPDLSVEGSIILGAGMAARLISSGVNPFAATALSMLVGCAAGFVTGFLHTKMKIPSILAGILTMVASYSVVIRLMGTSHIPLPSRGPLRVDTVFTFLQELGISGWNAFIVFSLGVVVVVCALLYWFFGTELGSSIRATGNNKQMVKALGINTDVPIIICLMLSNGLVALAGSIWAQQQGSAFVDMGAGTIVIGLASVVIAEVLFRARTFWVRLVSIIIGSTVYQLIIALALDIDFMKPTDLRLLTAIIVTIALVMPLIREKSTKVINKVFARRGR